MTEADVDKVLKRAARQPDGSYRVLASRDLTYLKGPSSFHGTRSDDPNDRIPHEHRREIRALRMICAWLNHEDIKSGNTTTQYVFEDGRHFLKHYLWDFGSTLGSDGIAPKYIRSGHANVVDSRQIGMRIITLNLWEPDWKKNQIPVIYPSVGRFGSQHFDPPAWKATIPSRAFDNMTDADGYWAAKIISSFSDEDIRAAVKAGRLSDPAAADYLAKALEVRRDIIERYYFRRVTPIEDVRTGPVTHHMQEIAFEDLAVLHDVAAKPPVYTFQVFLTNTEGGPKPVTKVETLNGAQSIVITHEMFHRLDHLLRHSSFAGEPTVVSIEVRSGRAWPMRMYFVYAGHQRGLRLVGVEHSG
jgi:hypothetical protein